MTPSAASAFAIPPSMNTNGEMLAWASAFFPKTYVPAELGVNGELERARVGARDLPRIPVEHCAEPRAEEDVRTEGDVEAREKSNVSEDELAGRLARVPRRECVVLRGVRAGRKIGSVRVGAVVAGGVGRERLGRQLADVARAGKEDDIDGEADPTQTRA